MRAPDIHKKLKIVFYRPHSNIWFKNPVRNILKKQLLPNKYECLLNNFLASGHKIYFTTALLVDFGFKNFIKSMVEPFELLMWCILNKISINNVGFIFRKQALADKDILISMYYGNYTYETSNIAKSGKKLAEYLSDVDILKVVHMTHYAYNPSIGASNLEIFKPDLLVAENNLAANSDFFRKYFSYLEGNFYHLPYTPASRFVRRTPFNGRLNKMVASGSITFKMKDPEFTNFYSVDELQPLRRLLYENASRFPNELDSQISDLNASRSDATQISKGSFGQRLWNRLFYKHPQIDYYKRDIVVTYNSYMMFTVPEEICNLPAIGFVEGMACGCAFFGLDDPMYRNLGLVPGVHYVAYDGSLSDLMEKVRFYQSNTAALEEIANSGYDFVHRHLTPQIVYKKFMDKLQTDLANRV